MENMNATGLPRVVLDIRIAKLCEAYIKDYPKDLDGLVSVLALHTALYATSAKQAVAAVTKAAANYE